MGLTILSYVAAFVGSAVLAWTITPLARRLATRLSVLDSPTDIKAHGAPVPYLGGAAIVTGFVLAVVVANAVFRPPGGFLELTLVLALGLGLAAMGLVDDLKGLGPMVRLLVEVGVAVALVASGVQVQAFSSGPVNAIVTVIWVVGLTNAFNLLDNMDGLSAGTGAIAAASFFVIAAVNGQFLVASLAAALAGCAMGFLRHNFHPATIYMGDAGSLFIGFMLAVIGLKLRFDGPTSVTFLVPILVCGVAIFDTALVTIERLKHGRSPLSGGRDHTSHRLVFTGLPVPFAVSAIYLTAVGLGWISLVIARIDRASAYLLAGLVVTVALVVGRMLSHVPVYGPTQRRLYRLDLQNESDAEASAWARPPAPPAGDPRRGVSVPDQAAETARG